ncbi:hypothetical protein [Iodobacter sp.]|uniref:hypothetical protein n=1 Tax=Iodobacter sp. TaxID=1915058 RepID=UPI0025E17ADE|nr:hypothetical protein [Iodobacter sp.]
MNKSILALTISASLTLSAFASAAGATPFKEPSRPAMNHVHSEKAANPSQTNHAQAKSHTKTPRIIPFTQRARPPMEAQAHSKPHSAAKEAKEVTPADMHPGRLKRTQYQ